MFNLIYELAEKYSENLCKQINTRMVEIEEDNNDHYLIYQVLGITNQEGQLIDRYQNKGRFLYKYAGAFLEKAAVICFKEKFPDATENIRIPNTLGARPKTFEIDCLVNNDAHEVKWRDATTDGDHITKEHTRVRVIRDKGLTPIRVMFYYPNRTQAIRIQQTLETLYKGVDGKYYYGDNAWKYIKEYTGIDLLNILHRIADLRGE